MAGRPKASLRQLVTHEDANNAMRDLLASQVDLDKQSGWLDLARAELMTKAEPGMDRLKIRIADITEQLQSWYHTHGKVEGRKSVQLTHGVIGERTGPPALKPLNRSWNWKAIGTKLQSVYGARFFHKAKDPAPDKDLLRAELNAEQLKNCGLKVEQEENFFVELDRTSLGDPQ